MPASMHKADPSPGCALERALALLNEALDILDDTADRPDIGARLQHLIEALREMCD